jgi:hypothetical protein
MPTTTRTGFPDSLHDSRLTHITGTSYPANPAGTFLGLYMGKMPDSSGTGGAEATGTRPAITLGAPQSDFNNRRYITHAAAVSATLTNTSPGEIVGFGIYAAATGGTPIYTGPLGPFQAQVAATVTIPAGAVRMYAEPPTI